MKTYYVYIMASHSRVLFVGMTSNLELRVHQHKHGLTPGFTSRYRIHRLVYFESTLDVHDAIAREKQLKKWNRVKKMRLIKSINPFWKDLSMDWGNYNPSH